MTRLQPERAPEWLRPMLDGIRDVDAATLSRHGIPPPADGAATVLILFGHDPDHGPDVLLTERASTLRSHAGQLSFPGGRTDPDDRDAVATALREAEEETGLEPAGVVPLAVLPDLFIPPTGYVVAPVIAHWADPTAVHAVDPSETATVVRVPVTVLPTRAPGSRCAIRPATSGRRSPWPGWSSGVSRGACCRRCWAWEAGNDPGTQRGCGIWTRHGPRCEPRVGRSRSRESVSESAGPLVDSAQATSGGETTS